MNQAFKDCIVKKRIFDFPRARKLVRKELRIASDDLNEVKDRFQNGKYKYAIINAYYAIFHSARALLYYKGYRERSHYCLYVAIDTLFVKAGLLEKHFSRILKDGMSLREDADYGVEFSKEGAALSISNAEEFIKKSEEFLSKKL